MSTEHLYLAMGRLTAGVNVESAAWSVAVVERGVSEVENLQLSGWRQPGMAGLAGLLGWIGCENRGRKKTAGIGETGPRQERKVLRGLDDLKGRRRLGGGAHRGLEGGLKGGSWGRAAALGYIPARTKYCAACTSMQLLCILQAKTMCSVQLPKSFISLHDRFRVLTLISRGASATAIPSC